MGMTAAFLAGAGAAGILFFLMHRKKANKQVKVGTMDLVLIILGIAILLFVLKMIQLFETYMAVPDTLITCFFALCGGECGVLGWIKTSKERNKERRWQLEDMERMKRESEKNGHQ